MGRQGKQLPHVRLHRYFPIDHHKVAGAAAEEVDEACPRSYSSTRSRSWQERYPVYGGDGKNHRGTEVEEGCTATTTMLMLIMVTVTDQKQHKCITTI